MKKIPTIFEKNPDDLSLVLRGKSIDNIKYFMLKIDGTSTAIIEGKLYKRYDAKLIKRKRGVVKHISIEEAISKLPNGAIACQEPDKLSGHWPHWVPVTKGDKYILEEYKNILKYYDSILNGTYECIGPKINNNMHVENEHIMIYHNDPRLKVIENVVSKDEDLYDKLYKYMESFPFEGLVAYDKNDNPIGKIRRSDFGFSKLGRYYSISEYFKELEYNNNPIYGLNIKVI